jgi:predicted Fe-Mo cluster-binding NifX family protein
MSRSDMADLPCGILPAFSLNDGGRCCGWINPDGHSTFEVDAAQRKITGRRDFPLLGHHACGFREWLREKGVGTMIVGGIGRGAIANLQAARISVCAGDSSRDVETLVQAYLDGGLNAATANCDHSHGQAHDHGHEHGHGHGGACHCHSH